MSKEILLDAPCVGETEKKYLCQAVDSGFVSTVGPFVPEFEKKITDYLGVKNAAAVQSGTAAIHMALHELGICDGDEVIVPSLTFAATINPVLYVGAIPVIVDVDINTWNIDPVKIREAVTEKTKAIIPVHLYGNPCNMSEIVKIAKEHNLYVIEDATESLGSKFNSAYTGTFGDFGCFSFNGNKLITTGGGGIIVSHNTEKIEHIRYLVNQAKDKDILGFHSEKGFNYRMTNIEAALGLAQFEKIDDFLAKKRTFKKIYQDILGNLNYVKFQNEYDGGNGSSWITCIKLDRGISLSGILRGLGDEGIQARRVFMPADKMPYLSKYGRKCYVAGEIYDSGICLPCSVINKQKDIKKAALMIKKVLDG